MDRSYNVFVDNGLYVLAYYLNKDINDITYQDIENSIDLMSDKIEEFVSCEKYSNLKSMCFSNSMLTQPKGKVTLNEKLKGFVKNQGDEYCSLCGQYKAKVKIEDKEYNIGRSYMPNLVANTFYNFSNNLQGLNVCPYCLVLTMYSILNCRVSRYVFLYNSTSDEFMKDYTCHIQDENLTDVELGAKKEKEKYSIVKLLESLVCKYNLFDGDIEQYMFNNSGQSQDIQVNNIKNSDVNLLMKLQKEALLREFKDLHLEIYILRGTLESNYLRKIYNLDKRERVASDELIVFLNREVNVLKKVKIDIIKKLTDKLKTSDLDIDKIYKELKMLGKFYAYEDWLVNLNEMYYEKTGEKLFEAEDYIELDDIRSFRQIKNLILVSLI
ncbi:hypothetical protein KWL13_013475 [Clostridioides difficile]|uniref:hypothetical protein n=1 Tax=Clostridioides difficile TaxID=1496 RepID=UPI000BB1B9DC|nr:hypothetical protein [Clostridioides difficile]EGT5270934.1 hypothetical protein [Clostridioides difficile]EGT5469559.1 hypothetical protein [Clostridioides difficile]MBH8088875.1 hypothetical protein [Clostridioides difficile]MBY1607703.1 hypothetical protein [Clostridioides difficile]MBY2078070.1 hypothetical protein [Clostridioides difficile]